MLRRLTLGTAALALAAAGFISPASANTPGGCNDIMITQDVAGTLYVELRGNGDYWIYLENGLQPGLQRGGEGGITTLSAFDPCQQANADTIVI